MIDYILTISLYILLSFTILIFIAWLYNVVIYIISNKDKAFFPRYYVKEIPFLINKSAIYRVTTAGQFLGIILLTTIVAFTLLINLSPYGAVEFYSLKQNSNNVSKLGPKERVLVVNDGKNENYKIIDGLVYFTTTLPFNFDSATIKIFYKNLNPEQTLSIGFQDQENWHYSYKPYEIPYLNSINWIKNGYSPVLYQRERKYFSVDEFYSNPPINGVIGTFEYTPTISNPSNTKLNSYIPQEKDTFINTALRGRHIMYAYLQREKFRMSFQKQDLNWYENSDEMNIKIYKNDEVVYEVQAKDDGIVDSSKKILPPQQIILENPSKELPEDGIYKIVFDANEDTVIKNIKTNLHKIVFANSIFPVANKEVYSGIVATTSATKVYTNALTISAATSHNPGKQNILVGDQVLGVNTLHTSTYLAPKDNIAEVVIPQNDVVLTGFLGYFAFEKDQFFLPTKYHILPITKAEDVELVDYILTDYLPSRTEGEWQVNEQTFDLRTAYIKDGKLSWIIKAPKLKERGGEIIIKDIQITFHKRGWL